MSKTYIAFLECTIHDNPPFWHERREFVDPESDEANSDSREEYIAEKEGAKLSLVDLNGKRRDYTFKQGGIVEMMGNVVMIIDWQLQEPPADKYQ